MTVAEICKWIEMARRRQLLALDAKEKSFNAVNAVIPDLSKCSTNAPLVKNLGEAIAFYIECGKYDIESIRRELTEALQSKQKKTEEST
jgi:hypothetical protein